MVKKLWQKKRSGHGRTADYGPVILLLTLVSVTADAEIKHEATSTARQLLLCTQTVIQSLIKGRLS